MGSHKIPQGRRSGLRCAVAGAAMVAALSAGGQAWADAPGAISGDEVEAIRQELNALRAEEAAERARQAARAAKMDELARRLDAVAGVPHGSPTSAVAAAGVAPAAEAITTAATASAAAPVAGDETSFEVYGFAQADYIQDFRRVDPDWEATLRPSKIPTLPGQFGGDGESILSVRQSRFGVKGGQVVGDLPMDWKFEFDMFGVGVDAGQTTIRLRHAYGQWGQFLAGQTNSLFMDGDIFPNVIDYWGPAGMVFLRNPQFRWTFINDGTLRFAVAAEKPGNDIDPGRIREIDPELGANIQAHDNVPDITAQFRYTGEKWGYVQLAGILRNLGFETLGTVDNRPKGNELGWGLNLTSNILFGDRNKLLGGVVYGQGIASYMNDGGTDLAPEGVPGNLHADAVKLLGLSFYYDHYWSDRWSTSLGWSQTKVDNTNFQAPEAFQTGQYASINLLFAPAPELLFGGEFLWGQRQDKDDNSAEDYRIQLTAKYNFSSGDLR